MLDRIGEAADPALVEVDGRLELRWPGDQRPASVEVATALLEGLVEEANTARRALVVLGEVASALAKLTG